ncbi:monodechloroaminopyrrolnitrin synthase PrnB family protein [Sphaerisporangium sp. B11E5]|uniref:monodechloroaminopyrrolnitrin synthase PrnB family protein n=1 Tax=Sphaerisporangium sp. B11E5 TaxID=3153563 RepID=UPI00325F562E
MSSSRHAAGHGPLAPVGGAAGPGPLAGLWSDRVPAARIAGADPLGLDPFMARLPELNAAGDTRAIIGGLRSAVPALAGLPAMEVWDSMAAVRDLGMAVASLVRHGLTAGDAPAGVEEALAEAGARVDMVPRETILHYSVWNPAGARRRTFTGAPGEHVLIECSVAGTLPLEKAARALSTLVTRGVGTGEHRFTVTCLAAARDLEQAAAHVHMERTGLDPVFFTRHLRPYFEPFTVRGVSYHAPAAAHLPLYAVDQAVWAADAGHDRLDGFRADLVPYGLPVWTACHEDLLGVPSLLTRTLRDLDSRVTPGVLAGARALLAVLKAMIVFRGRHRRLVRGAYQDALRGAEIGSGGAGMDLIDELLAATRAYGELAGTAVTRASRHLVAEADLPGGGRRPA